MSDDPIDVVIVGGGPAGASAAVFTARAELATVVIDADKGITRRAMLNNHFGFPDGIPGPELVDRGRAHATNAGATWITATRRSTSRRNRRWLPAERTETIRPRSS